MGMWFYVMMFGFDFVGFGLLVGCACWVVGLALVGLPAGLGLLACLWFWVGQLLVGFRF